MAQTNSVPREPSMEEILASIRRIIEDSDTGRPAGEALEAEPQTQAANSDVAADLNAVRESLARHVSGSALLQPNMAQAESADDMMRDRRIAEELRPSLAAFSAQPEQAVDEPAEAQATRYSEAPAFSEAPSFSEAPAFSETSAFSAASPFSGDDDEQDLDRHEPLLGFEDLLEEALSRDDMPSPAAANPLPSIISDRTGRQVAAAFGELSEAFAATRQKSFDEMAEAMLRPMLSDWLDNNLPTLVERLVREEIERIARGPAR